MSKILLLALFIALHGSLLGALKVDKNPLDIEALISAGEVSFEYKLKNMHEDAVVVYHVDADCGCTSLDFDDRVVEPLDSFSVSGIYDLEGRMGIQKVKLFLKYANQSGETFSMVLSLRVNVIHPVTIEPQVLSLKSSQEIHSEFDVFIAENCRITYIEPNEHFDVFLKNTKDISHKKLSLKPKKKLTSSTTIELYYADQEGQLRSVKAYVAYEK